MAFWPLCFALFPLVNVIAEATMKSEGESSNLRVLGAGKAIATEPASVAVWLAVLALLIVQRLATMAYPYDISLSSIIMAHRNIFADSAFCSPKTQHRRTRSWVRSLAFRNLWDAFHERLHQRSSGK